MCRELNKNEFVETIDLSNMPQFYERLKYEEDEEEDVVITINGAGTDVVNGSYYPTEKFHNGFRIYSKTGSFKHRRIGSCLIWRSESVWLITLITTLKQGEELLRHDGLHCYVCYKDSNSPPAAGWEKETGTLPVPKLTKTTNKMSKMKKSCLKLLKLDVHDIMTDCSFIKAAKEDSSLRNEIKRLHS